VGIPSSIVIIRALISIIITPHKRVARISEEALTGLENLCLDFFFVYFSLICVRCHLFLGIFASQIWRRFEISL
jgi:uncharacterized protein YybS (DUF2232 family)